MQHLEALRLAVFCKVLKGFPFLEQTEKILIFDL